MTFACTAALVLVGFVLASLLDDAFGMLGAALAITAVDAALPVLVRLISAMERHHNVVTHDLSFMNKVNCVLGGETEWGGGGGVVSCMSA